MSIEPLKALEYKISSQLVDIDDALLQIGVATRDLTTLARKGMLSPIVGRQKELTWLCRRLLCRYKPNAFIVGPSGVGKTALIEGLAMYATSSDQPTLNQLRFIEINAGSLMAGTAYRGDLEKKVLQLLELVQEHPTIVLFIDEAHVLAMTGDIRGGGIDVMNLLKPHLTSGALHCLLATTVNEFQHLASDEAFGRRFAMLTLQNLTCNEQQAAVALRARQLEKYHGMTVDAKVLQHVQNTLLMIPQGLDRSLDFLDELCAEAFLSGQRSVTLNLMEKLILQSNEQQEDIYGN